MKSLRSLFAASLLCFSATIAVATDLTITVASFVPSAAAQYYPRGTTGVAALTAGQLVYLDSTTGTWLKAKADAASTSVTNTTLGLACHASSPGQPLTVLKSDTALAIGSTVVVDKLYVVSAAVAGSIAPSTDLTTGNYIYVFAIAPTASTLNVDFTSAKTTTAALP